MPTANDFRAIRVQFVLFTPGLQFRSAKILANLLTKYESQFDGEPITFPPFEAHKGPVPKGAIELQIEPRVVLQGQEGKLRLMASPSRLDVSRESDTISEEEIVTHLNWACDLGLSYLGFNDAKAGRVACIIHRLCDSEKPAATLSRHFCKEQWISGPLSRPSDFELHAHKRFPLPGLFEVNSWMRFKTVVSRDDTGQKPNAILVEQDLNSLSEQIESREMSQTEIRKFFELAPGEMRHVLEMYMPQVTS
jgi:hypothetical protein